MDQLSDCNDSLFSDQYRQLADPLLAVAESNVPSSPRPGVRERLVRCLWFDQSLTSDALRLESGQRLRVLSPGWWNLEKGPDFLKAAIRIGRNETINGDIEVHVRLSDWYAHGHDKDPYYDSVVLHVSLWNDCEESFLTNSKGSQVPTLTLASFLTSPVDELAENVDPSEYPQLAETEGGQCCQKLNETPNGYTWLGRFLGHAGDQRILAKADKFRARLNGGTLDQILFEGIAETLGAKQNKSQMLQLARLAPYCDLASVAQLQEDGAIRRVESVLFAMSGMLPTASDMSEADRHTQSYVSSLNEEWSNLQHRFANSAMKQSQWRFASTRPVNFPTRRIAALAAVVVSSSHRGLLQTFIDMLGTESVDRASTLRRLWTSWLASLPGSYWTTHCVFGKKPFPKPTRLVGVQRAGAIIVDVLVPSLLLHARKTDDTYLERTIHRVFCTHPLLPKTSVTRFMVQRLFGERGDTSKVITGARRQQGLYQLFRDCCEKGDLACRRCLLISAMESSEM